MKTVGLIGGMSWESTMTYYKVINEAVKAKLGGFHSAKLLLYSVDFAEIESCQIKGEWDASADILAEAAQKLELAGADFIIICTNTMHKVISQIQEKIEIPIIHIATATAEELKKKKITKVALLGTKYTMTQKFYKEKIMKEGIEVLIPSEADVELVNHIIYEELCMGIINNQSKEQYVRIIEELENRGAQGVILGCTEIGLLIQQEDVSLPVFDTTLIHGEKAAFLLTDA